MGGEVWTNGMIPAPKPARGMNADREFIDAKKLKTRKNESPTGTDG